MHIEILVEDSSGEKLLATLLPQFLGEQGEPHTWRVHAYKGIGRIPKNLNAGADPAKRILLDQLPRLLQGYGRTPGVDAVVVVLDSDKRNCADFLAELNALADGCAPVPNTLFRLAIEEVEAWYLGDQDALLAAYPRAKRDILGRYAQDSPCDTWDLLLTEAVVLQGTSGMDDVAHGFDVALAAARSQGERLFSEMLEEHSTWLKAERERARYAFDARYQAIGRIGLPAVREHRRKRLSAEHQARMAVLDDAEASVPDIHAVMMLRVGNSIVGDGQGAPRP